MKKTIVYLILLVTICFSSPQKTYAWGIVFDPTMYGKQIAQFIKETSIAISSGTTAVQETLDTVNNLVLRPMKDAMTLMQIVKNGQMVKTLVTASTGGDALLVSNPKLYLQNKGIAVTQGGVDALASQNGIFSGSVMNSVVAKAKIDNSSLANNLTAINQSNIPNIEKAKICNDSALSDMAKSQVSLSGGDYNTVKRNLNSSLCVGNPNTDPALAKRLVAVSNRSPSLDTFYAITSGDNAYTKAQLSQIEISKQAELAKTMAAKDSASGVKSKTTCTKMASNGMCIEDTINQTASVINKQYQDALGSDLKTAISSFGSGAGSIIGTAFNALSLFNGLTSTMQGVVGTVSGSGGSSGNSGTLGSVSIPTTTSLPTTTSINTTYSSSSGSSQDLINNAQARETISGAPKDLLKQHQKTLTDLKNTDNNYLTSINSYNSQLDSMKACYDNVLKKFPNDISPEDSRIVAAMNFYNQHKKTNASLSSKVTAELNKIDFTYNLITNTISTIDNSNSTDEITKAFKNYQVTVRDQELPDISTGMNALTEQIQYAGDLQISTIDGGEIFNLNATCSGMGPAIVNQN